MKTRSMNELRKVYIEAGPQRFPAWEAKDPRLQALGRWTDPQALLRRIYEWEHPEETVDEGPGRQWQATWRGRFVPGARTKRRNAA